MDTDDRLPPRRDYLTEFANALKSVRLDSGLTQAGLAKKIGRDASRISRAEKGIELPVWELTEKYLTECGVSATETLRWRERWKVASRVDKRRGAPSGTQVEEGVFWMRILRDWDASQPKRQEFDSLVTRLNRVETPKDFGLALKVLIEKADKPSLRRIEQLEQLPKSTVSAWCTGARKPDSQRFDLLLNLLDASPAEREGFMAALDRAFPRACDEYAPGSRLQCELRPNHRGFHKASNGRHWLDEG